jgi:hypothetical protein
MKHLRDGCDLAGDHYFWRAVDHEGEVLESFVTKTRDKAAALKFIKRAMKRHGRAKAIVTDGLRSYGAPVTGRPDGARAEGLGGDQGADIWKVRFWRTACDLGCGERWAGVRNMVAA